jgi:hypothetical protein
MLKVGFNHRNPLFDWERIYGLYSVGQFMRPTSYRQRTHLLWVVRLLKKTHQATIYNNQHETPNSARPIRLANPPRPSHARLDTFYVTCNAHEINLHLLLYKALIYFPQQFVHYISRLSHSHFT